MIFLYPSANGFKTAMKKVVASKVRSALCDEETMSMIKNAEYEAKSDLKGASRTIHGDIPPPDVRLRSYKTK